MQTTYTYTIELDEDGYYVAGVPQLPGCHTQARTLDELQVRIKEAIELYLEVKPNLQLTKFIGIQQVEV